MFHIFSFNIVPWIFYYEQPPNQHQCDQLSLMNLMPIVDLKFMDLVMSEQNHYAKIEPHKYIYLRTGVCSVEVYTQNIPKTGLMCFSRKLITP